MRYYFSLLLIFILNSSFAGISNDTLLLFQSAYLLRVDSAEIFNAKVPGSIYNDLFLSKKIPDPFFGDNEKNLKWIQKENWIYIDTFLLSEENLSGSNIVLLLEGVDTYADVYLNDEKVSDSARSDFYYQKSAVYSRKGENLEMFRLTLQALKYAEKSKSSYYKARAYRALGVYYKTLNEYEKAMEWHEKERLLVEEGKNKKSINNVNFIIARCYRDWNKNNEAVEKYNTVITNSLAVDDRFNLGMAVTELYDLYLKLGKRNEADSLDKRFQLLEKRKAATGLAGYHFKKGWYYSLFNNDSMRFHYKKAVLYADSLKDSPNELETKNYVYTNLISFFRKEGEFQTAILTGQKALSVINKLGLIANLPSVYEDLDSAYQSIGDFKNAYAARREYDFYQDSLNALNDKTEALRLETIAEEENIANTENEKKKATERKHDIQYRFIILGVILLLIGLLAIGFLHPPNWLVKGLAFVSFIFIFEFIILILDSKLHHWFHGAPLPILGVKVLIACLLVPLHHLVEKKVIHFLQSKKLHRLKTVFKDEPVKSV